MNSSGGWTGSRWNSSLTSYHMTNDCTEGAYQCLAGTYYRITGTYGHDRGPPSSWGWRGTGGDRGLERGGTHGSTISAFSPLNYNPWGYHYYTIYRCVVSRTLLGQCSILILDQLSDRTIIQPTSLASCSGHWHNSASKPESQEREKLDWTQVFWHLYKPCDESSSIQSQPLLLPEVSDIGLFVAITSFPQEGCASPWVQDLVCLKEAALPLDLKSGLNTARIFWSWSNNISLLYFLVVHLSEKYCYVDITSQTKERYEVYFEWSTKCVLAVG